MNDSTVAPALPAGRTRTRVRLQLFGAFREYGRKGELTVEVPSGTTVAGLRVYVKAALARALPARRPDPLVDVSALASEHGVLPETESLSDAEVCLAILPPVCGG